MTEEQDSKRAKSEKIGCRKKASPG